MMVDVTVEGAMTEMEKKINFLMKVFDEGDHEIAALRDQMQVYETTKSSKILATKADDKGKVMLQENQMQQFISVTCLLVQQLQDMITSSKRV